MKVLLPTTMPLDPDLPEGVVAIRYDVAGPLPAAHLDAEVLVAWGNPPQQLEEAARTMPDLRLVQGLAAGPDALVAAGFGPQVLLAGGRSLHDLPVAEHTLALVLAAARRLDLATRAQVGHRWAVELGGLQPAGNSDRFTTLRGAHVVIWGFGSIAGTLAPHLAALGARVTGVARTAGQRDGWPVVTAGSLPELLPTADVLVMLLPDTPTTRRCLDATVLGWLPGQAWVVNVGRGATLDEDALVAALREGRLAGAALDVAAQEPLPVDSPLWDAPNVLITPHAAGGRPLGADGLIAANVSALREGAPLRNLVERPESHQET